MRYLDELLLSYPRAPALVRRFILSQVFDHVPGTFSGPVSALLRRELFADEASIRRRARHVLGQFLPLETRARHGLGNGPIGIWTNLVQGGACPDVPAPPDDPRAVQQAARLVRSACHLLQPAVERALGLLERGTPVQRVLASLALGRFPVSSLFESLGRRVDGEPVPFAPASALADLGGDEAREALVAAARSHAPSNPDLIVLLRNVPAPSSLAALEQLESRVDDQGRSNIALALASHPLAAARGLIEKLARRREGWVLAQLLDTLGGYGDPECLGMIRRIWAGEPHEFVRMQALRAAGSIVADGAADFCLQRLCEPSERLRSVALESLARQGLRHTELVSAARLHLESPFVRARAHSVLITALEDPDAAGEPIARLVLADDPLLRLEGAYVLGHLHDPRTLAFLQRMAREDPSREVRDEAIRSLCRFEPDAALGALLALLDHPDPEVIASVTHGLEGIPASAAGAVLHGLETALASCSAPAARAAVARCLGLVAAVGDRPVPAVLAGALDAEQEVRLAALEGVARLGDRAAGIRLPAPDRTLPSRERAWLAVAGWLTGSIERGSVLADLLASDREGDADAALEALVEIGAFVPYSLHTGRHARLVRALDDHLSDPGYREHERVEIDLTRSWRPCAGLQRRATIDRPGPRPISRAPGSLADGARPSLDIRYRPAHGPGPDARTEPPSVDSPPSPPERTAAPHLAAACAARAGKSAAVAVIVAAILWLARSPGPIRPSPGARPGSFRVERLDGAATRRLDGGSSSPLGAGDPVFAGTVVATAAGARITLLDPVGNSIWLGPSSSVRIAVSRPSQTDPGRSRFVFSMPTGDCILDFKRSPDVTIEQGALAVTLSSGSLRVVESGGEAQLRLIAGQGRICRAGAAPQPLACDQTVSVPVPPVPSREPRR